MNRVMKAWVLLAANRRHPLRGFGGLISFRSTGSRTHPWLYSGIPSGFNRRDLQKSLITFLLIIFLLSPLIGCVTAPSAGHSSTAEKQKDSSAPQSGTEAQAPAATEAPRYSGPIQFTDVTAQAGINFKHNSGAF